MPRRSHPIREGFAQADQLLELLFDRALHTTKELVKLIGHRFSNAIYQLRRRGHTIKREPHPTKKHQHQYHLIDDE